MSCVKNFLADESGATAIEYALIGSLIAMAIIAGMTAIYGSVGNTMNTVSNSIESTQSN